MEANFLESLETIPTVVLDPYLVINMTATLTVGALLSCKLARFVICDHFSVTDFLSDGYVRLKEGIDQEKLETVSVSAVDMSDLLPMRNVLALSQVAIIAAARCHQGLFASDCCVFRRMAQTVPSSDNVICGRTLRERFCLN